MAGRPISAHFPYPTPFRSTLIAAGPGPGSALATDTITRSGGTLPTLPSRPVAINWDFTVAGQDHANAPQLLNPDLPAVQVFGEGSRTENHIDIRDEFQRIYASVPLYRSEERRVGKEGRCRRSAERHSKND